MSDMATTRLLELGMEKNRERIEEAWRCPECDGKGQMRTGCAMFYALYDSCFACSGTGRKQRWDPLSELFDATMLEAKFQERFKTVENMKDDLSGRMWFLILIESRKA